MAGKSYYICPKCKQKHLRGEECNIDVRTEKQKEQAKFYKSKRWRDKRKEIIKRDNGLCQRCKIKYQMLNGNNLEVHHIKSRENYPELQWDDENLICICGTCNKQLGTNDVLDFEWEPIAIDYSVYFGGDTDA